MEEVTESLLDDVVRAKDFNDRGFQMFTQNFYLCKAFLRYFSVKRGTSFNSSKVSKKFPLSVTVAGTCLSVLEDLEVVESRTSSSSASRYMPGSVDLEKLEKIEEVLKENREIDEFTGKENS
ncbi:hypothetical protein GKQ38_02190 [Candidatus Nanohaloarchaea archaeon]|nr:hypothetical protein GKQ38_02190 [Candidatus Nanohaloarchaea archaeon]